MPFGKVMVYSPRGLAIRARGKPELWRLIFLHQVARDMWGSRAVRGGTRNLWVYHRTGCAVLRDIPSDRMPQTEGLAEEPFGRRPVPSGRRIRGMRQGANDVSLQLRLDRWVGR